MADEKEDVYCTLVMSDSYLPGAAVLAHSLRDNGTKKKLAVIITPDCLRPSTVAELKSLYDHVIPVERIGNPNPSNLYLMNRGDLLYAFTKINLWRQVQFRKIVYLDADVVALRAPDELFEIKASFAGAPDVGWPDAFNTGVMVLTPHMGEFWALKTLAATGDSFDGADQGLLNQYYEHKDWHRLSFTYNCTPSANYQYEPAYRYHKARISMVHFIGKDKPWNASTSQNAAPGAYNELLYRWWAVYDRHFCEPAHEYASGRYTPASLPAAPGETAIVAPEADVTTTEPDLSEPREYGEELSQGVAEPMSTVEQRRVAAPYAEWDATRSAPPSDAKPEAYNFPSQTYDFNNDNQLYRPPRSYPEPPKDMWFEVPKSKPLPHSAKPAPIFPWEGRQDSRPTRRFADDASPERTPPLETATEVSESFPVTPIIKITHDDPWQAYTSGTKNAWDDMSGIDKYVRALNSATVKDRRRSLHNPTGNTTSTQFERRESLILTDFPSEVDRPSLPVTPAPIRRPTFWGSERESSGQLPSADGVPNQADWNPSEKLEDLRRGSLTMPMELHMPQTTLPDRAMPPTAVSETENVESSTAQSSGPSASSSSTATPRFNTSTFTTPNSESSKEEGVLSPTEHGSRHF